MNIYIIAAGAAVFLIGGVFATYQLYKLVKTDAACRGIKIPVSGGRLRQAETISRELFCTLSAGGGIR